MCGCRTEYSATWGHTSVVGNMQYSEKSTAFAVNQGGTANKKSNYSSLADVIFLPRIFIYKGEKGK